MASDAKGNGTHKLNKFIRSKQLWAVWSTFLALDADQAEPVVQLLESVVQVEHSTAQAVPVPVVSTTADLVGPGCTPAEIDQGKPAGILRFGSC